MTAMMTAIVTASMTKQRFTLVMIFNLKSTTLHFQVNKDVINLT